MKIVASSIIFLTATNIWLELFHKPSMWQDQNDKKQILREPDKRQAQDDMAQEKPFLSSRPVNFPDETGKMSERQNGAPPPRCRKSQSGKDPKRYGLAYAGLKQTKKYGKQTVFRIFISPFRFPRKRYYFIVLLYASRVKILSAISVGLSTESPAIILASA